MFRSAKTSPILCRHVDNLGDDGVSACWPGLDCGADLWLLSDNTDDKNISYQLFRDNCQEGDNGVRTCAVEFVRNCQDKEEQENKKVERLTLGIQNTRVSDKEKKRISENSIADGNLRIIRKDINPNIIVNYLNKKKNSYINSEKKTPVKFSLPGLKPNTILKTKELLSFYPVNKIETIVKQVQTETKNTLENVTQKVEIEEKQIVIIETTKNIHNEEQLPETTTVPMITQDIVDKIPQPDQLIFGVTDLRKIDVSALKRHLKDHFTKYKIDVKDNMLIRNSVKEIPESDLNR